MPLYTYIVTFKGSSYVAQAKHSNFRGFVTSWTELPQNAIKGLTPDLKRDLSQKAYRGEFDEVPNRKHVWKKSIDLDGDEFIVFAIQTEP
jgi:hypothetical protein